MRICSFLPSATEILYALGLGDSVAGVTFECDYPPEAREKPVLVNSSLSHETDAASIDQQVSAAAARGESLYRIDAEALKGIEPDIIVTQELCHVCAVTPGELGSALTNLSRSPHMISLHSHRLEGVWQDIMTVAEATDRRAAGEALLKEIEGRLAAVGQAVGAVTERPRVLCIEWLDPPFHRRTLGARDGQAGRRNRRHRPTRRTFGTGDLGGAARNKAGCDRRDALWLRSRADSEGIPIDPTSWKLEVHARRPQGSGLRRGRQQLLFPSSP